MYLWTFLSSGMFRCSRRYLKCHFLELFWCLCLKLKNSHVIPMNRLCFSCLYQMFSGWIQSSDFQPSPDFFSLRRLILDPRCSGSWSWFLVTPDTRTGWRSLLWSFTESTFTTGCFYYPRYRKQQDAVASDASFVIFVSCSSSCKITAFQQANMPVCVTVRNANKANKLANHFPGD